MEVIELNGPAYVDRLLAILRDLKVSFDAFCTELELFGSPEEHALRAKLHEAARALEDSTIHWRCIIWSTYDAEWSERVRVATLRAEWLGRRLSQPEDPQFDAARENAAIDVMLQEVEQLATKYQRSPPPPLEEQSETRDGAALHVPRNSLTKSRVVYTEPLPTKPMRQFAEALAANPGRPKIDIALEIANGNENRAASIVRQHNTLVRKSRIRFEPIS